MVSSEEDWRQAPGKRAFALPESQGRDTSLPDVQELSAVSSSLKSQGV